jgi:hypothetical protein
MNGGVDVVGRKNSRFLRANFRSLEDAIIRRSILLRVQTPTRESSACAILVA